MVLGTGMIDCHTVRERVRVEDLVQTVELILEILALSAG